MPSVRYAFILNKGKKSRVLAPSEPVELGFKERIRFQTARRTTTCGKCKHMILIGDPYGRIRITGWAGYNPMGRDGPRCMKCAPGHVTAVSAAELPDGTVPARKPEHPKIKHWPSSRKTSKRPGKAQISANPECLAYFADKLTTEFAKIRSRGQPSTVTISSTQFLSWLIDGLETWREDIAAKAERSASDMLPSALGSNGSGEDLAEIDRAVSRLGDTYRAALDWPRKCQSVRTTTRWHRVLCEAELLSVPIVRAFDEFAKQLTDEVGGTARRAPESKARTVRLRFKPRDFDTTRLMLEINAAANEPG